MHIRHLTRPSPALRRLDSRIPWERLSWPLVSVGVMIMIGLFLTALVMTRPETDPVPGALPAVSPTPAPVVVREPFQPPEASDTPPASASPEPGATTPPAIPAAPPRRNSGSGSGSGGGNESDSGGAPQTTRPPAPKPPPVTPTVTGRYRLLDSYGDSFIGEVLLTNVTPTSRSWTVTLRFPTNVGSLRTAWVEGAPQATIRWSGRTATFTGTATLSPGSSVPLRFHFDRTGSDVRPEVCTANGTACS